MIRGCSLLALLMVLGCQSEPKAEQTTQPASAEPVAEEPQTVGPVDAELVTERVQRARERLQSSEAGKLVWQAIEAHGGLWKWLSQGTVAFTFDYAPLEEPDRRMNTQSKVDLWSAQAWQKERGPEAQATLGFNGQLAWILPGPEAFPTPARFWATTPYYFIGVPFVMGDPGTRFERMDDADLDGVAHRIVKVTYEPGTGDSPDDYYILYIHPKTHQVSGLRYIVAYPGLFPEGEHSPEKLMVFGEKKRVQGLLMPHRLDTYAWDAEENKGGDKVTDVTASDFEFGKTWKETLFDPPPAAVGFEKLKPPAEGGEQNEK